MEVLSHHVVELILERLPVESLIRFKSVSKEWKSTIESKNFQERQLIHRQQSRVPDVLFLHYPEDNYYHNKHIPSSLSSSSSSSSSSVVPIMFATMNDFACSTSCDGLVCLYHKGDETMGVTLFNPATRWQRTLPPSQKHSYDRNRSPNLGFGKDKFNGNYKLVWLYNNNPQGFVTTTCEVFDFSNNAWRYVTPASPYEIAPCFHRIPVYVDGSLHWFTNCKDETKILSFDLHTETFQVIANAPFGHLRKPENKYMCNLNNRLCVSEKLWPDQVIWCFDSENKMWNHMYTIDLGRIFPRVKLLDACALLPLAVLQENNNKLLFYGRTHGELVIYDLQTKSFDLVFTYTSYGYPIGFSQSFTSIL